MVTGRLLASDQILFKATWVCLTSQMISYLSNSTTTRNLSPLRTLATSDFSTKVAAEPCKSPIININMFLIRSVPLQQTLLILKTDVFPSTMLLN